MNITPAQIPDEVAEMLVQALIDWEQDESDSALTTHVKAALAAALPVLLGEPVAWNVSWTCRRTGKTNALAFNDAEEACDFLHDMSNDNTANVVLKNLYTPETPNER